VEEARYIAGMSYSEENMEKGECDCPVHGWKVRSLNLQNMGKFINVFECPTCHDKRVKVILAPVRSLDQAQSRSRLDAYHTGQMRRPARF
jgi:hypothetical protein